MGLLHFELLLCWYNAAFYYDHYCKDFFFFFKQKVIDNFYNFGQILSQYQNILINKFAEKPTGN